MLYGTLSTWKTDTVYFDLKEDTNPICSRTYPIPKVNEEMFKKEVERLVLLGFLDVDNGSEWRALSFAQHKLKSNQVSFLSDFRNINKKLNKKPYPIPKLNEMLMKL